MCYHTPLPRPVPLTLPTVVVFWSVFAPRFFEGNAEQPSAGPGAQRPCHDAPVPRHGPQPGGTGPFPCDTFEVLFFLLRCFLPSFLYVIFVGFFVVFWGGLISALLFVLFFCSLVSFLPCFRYFVVMLFWLFLNFFLPFFLRCFNTTAALVACHLPFFFSFFFLFVL